MDVVTDGRNMLYNKIKHVYKTRRGAHTNSPIELHPQLPALSSRLETKALEFTHISKFKKRVCVCAYGAEQGRANNLWASSTYISIYIYEDTYYILL